MVTTESVREALKTVIDPELGLNIVDLGLIYEVEVDDAGVRIVMSMTSAACPMHNLLSRLAENAVRDVAGAEVQVNVDVVFDPPWTPDLMSDEARRLLG
ncbi:aromatic ring hydroxylase [bacterium]|nr:MAG: aromatic ring hydroxylase [bacterium]